MKRRLLPAWLRRWRALRAPQLTTSSPEGTIVRVSGVVRIIDEPLTSPLGGQRCVVVLTTYTLGETNNRTNLLTVVERLQTRRFVVEATSMHVAVEPSAVELLLPARVEGRNQEIAVTEGQIITVVGSVLRDGAELPTTDQAFRDARPSCTLVGGPSHPIVITA